MNELLELMKTIVKRCETVEEVVKEIEKIQCANLNRKAAFTDGKKD